MASKNPYDKQHEMNVLGYQRRIREIFETANKEMAAIGATVSGFNPSKPFRFSDYPMTKARLDSLVRRMNEDLTTCVVDGVHSEWTLANNKNSELARRVFGDNIGKLSKEQHERYFNNHAEAEEAFLARKTDGLRLSDRVWNYTDQYKEEMEMALDYGIRRGQDAATMALDMQQYLRHPDKLFRRVRDEHGVLRLSQAAKAYHPGAGVYRSSYKNARRLAGTETNIAYRTADHERWKDFDFVVGIEVKTSKTNHVEEDICDCLAGKYPKDFKFVGWHPQCRCYVTTIQKTDDEFIRDLNNDTDTPSVNAVGDVPGGFKEWIKDNESRIVRKGRLPYFISDNQSYVTDIMRKDRPSTRIAEQMMTPHFKDYAAKMAARNKDVAAMMSRLESGPLADSEKAIIVNQVKNECAAVTHRELMASGVVGDDWILARREFDSTIQEKAVVSANGRIISIDRVRMDLLIYKDPFGVEFAYPVGADAGKIFSGVTASEAFHELPPYLRRGIKRVSILNVPCPLDPYWKVKYNNPKHVSMATDGGSPKFYGTPADKRDFKGYMAHEAAHNIDENCQFSNSEEWREAVRKDGEFHAAYFPGGRWHRVSEYAKTNDMEDFAECVREYYGNESDRRFLKDVFPHRAAFIRKVGQTLSGHPRTP